jgi:hypothetical protein
MRATYRQEIANYNYGQSYDCILLTVHLIVQSLLIELPLSQESLSLAISHLALSVLLNEVPIGLLGGQDG